MNKEEQDLISLMKSGWQLGCSYITGKFWVQQEKLGSGLPAVNIKETTVENLLARKIIYLAQERPGFPKLFELTESQ